jgi:hypothetical protein
MSAPHHSKWHRATEHAITILPILDDYRHITQPRSVELEPATAPRCRSGLEPGPMPLISLSRSCEGGLGWGCPTRIPMFVVRAPTRRALPSAIAEVSLRRSYRRTAAEGGLCSPASGRGEELYAVLPVLRDAVPPSLKLRRTRRRRSHHLYRLWVPAQGRDDVCVCC